VPFYQRHMDGNFHHIFLIASCRLRKFMNLASELLPLFTI